MKVKICGITNLSDAKCAVENGADFIGFILYPKSPRYISPQSIKEILSQLPLSTMSVGVFVNETTEKMRDIYQSSGLSMLQLHGDESQEQIDQLKPIRVLKALSLQTKGDLLKIRNYVPYKFLVDTPSENYGGTGKVANWELASKVSGTNEIFLAGGLTPKNVIQAIHEVNPHGVDVSSGVEKESGIKDHKKIKEFIHNAKSL